MIWYVYRAVDSFFLDKVRWGKLFCVRAVSTLFKYCCIRCSCCFVLWSCGLVVWSFVYMCFLLGLDVYVFTLGFGCDLFTLG